MKTTYITILALFWALTASAQHVLLQEDFSDADYNVTFNTNKWEIGSSSPNVSGSGGNYLKTNIVVKDVVTLSTTINVVDYDSIEVTWYDKLIENSLNTTTRILSVTDNNGKKYESSDGNSYSDTRSSVTRFDKFNWGKRTVKLDFKKNYPETLTLTWTVEASRANSHYYAIDDIRITATPMDPVIDISSKETLMFESYFDKSVAKSYTVSGVYLANTMSIVATTDPVSEQPKFLIALSENGEYLESQTINTIDGTLTNVPIFVKYESYEVGTHNGLIKHTSNGLTVKLGVCGVTSEIPTAPLPVELSSFQGRADKGAVNLSWTTATEKDNDKFVIEHSLNGKSFSQVGQVKGHGTSATARSYRFTDQAPAGGINYYRLRQVDTDGAESLSNVIALELAAGGLEASVYPTVTTSAVTVNLQRTTGPASITVTDMAGRTVATFSATTEHEIKLPVHSFRNGVYFVKVTDGQSQQVKRFIKE